MSKYKRVSLIVMDSVGVGEYIDAKEYGDEGANTLVNIAKAAGPINAPNLEKLGIGLLGDVAGIEKVEKPLAVVTKMAEKSVGKDTITGHWELMGLKISKPFKTFTDTGFPQELIDELEERTGKKYIGNKSASGTEILVELGEQHLKTGELILYTSADSVLQIAASEDIVPIEELYKICEIARDITMKDEWKVGRIIARPFLGKNKDEFKRTPNRHDYALEPFNKIVLSELEENNIEVISVGKINDIYCGKGIKKAIKSKSNHDGMEKHMEALKELKEGLIFTNLVDFDALYGHRRDAVGYKEAIEEFDVQLGQLMDMMTNEDLLIIVADHGNDPTHKGTDHTREYVPMLAYSPKLEKGELIEVRESFADVGVSILENFLGKKEHDYEVGKSFMNYL